MRFDDTFCNFTDFDPLLISRNFAFQVIDKLKLDAATRLQMMQEVRLMKLVQHPYVVRLYEVIDTQTKLYLVLEFADGK